MVLARIRLKHTFENILFSKANVIAVTTVTISAVVAAVVVTWLLFTSPPAPMQPAAEVKLDIDTIDELELFIETRQTTYENPPRLPVGTFQ